VQTHVLVPLEFLFVATAKKKLSLECFKHSGLCEALQALQIIRQSES
jgi:hypothetical protein